MQDRTFEVCVNRKSLSEPAWVAAVFDPKTQKLVISSPVEGSPKLPLTEGTTQMCLQALELVGGGGATVTFVVEDQNVVEASRSWDSDFIAENAHLSRLATAVQGFQGTVTFERAMPDRRLGFAAGEAVAAARVAAVAGGLFGIYPSPTVGKEDTWEVRWLDDVEDCMRVEWCPDWGWHETEQFISLATEMGQGQRLLPKRLALDDPVAFWISVFRFRKAFNALDKACDSSEWEALHAGASEASSRQQKGSLGTFKEMERKVAEDNERRNVIARIGVVSVIQPIMEKGNAMRPGRKIVLHWTEYNEDSWVGQVGSAIQAKDAALSPPLMAKDEIVIIKGLVSQPFFNGKKGRIVSPVVVDGRVQVFVVNEQGDEMILRVKPSNLEKSEADAKSETTMDMQLMGAFRECSLCAKAEEAHKTFRACAKCRTAFYCSKECQKRHWEEGHKSYCGKKGPQERPNYAAQVVVLSCDKTKYPRGMFIDGGDNPCTAMRNIATQIFKCDPDECGITDILRGEPWETAGCKLFFRQTPSGSTGVGGNARASTLVTTDATILDCGPDGVPNLVQGDAVIMRFHGKIKQDGREMYFDATEPMRLSDYTMDDWDMPFGRFQMLFFPKSDIVKALGSFFPRSAEGDAWHKHFIQMAKNAKEGKDVGPYDPKEYSALLAQARREEAARKAKSGKKGKKGRGHA